VTNDGGKAIHKVTTELELIKDVNNLIQLNAKQSVSSQLEPPLTPPAGPRPPPRIPSFQLDLETDPKPISLADTVWWKTASWTVPKLVIGMGGLLFKLGHGIGWVLELILQFESVRTLFKLLFGVCVVTGFFAAIGGIGSLLIHPTTPSNTTNTTNTTWSCTPGSYPAGTICGSIYEERCGEVYNSTPTDIRFHPQSKTELPFSNCTAWCAAQSTCYTLDYDAGSRNCNIYNFIPSATAPNPTGMVGLITSRDASC
jgi:hypothetical protein